MHSTAFEPKPSANTPRKKISRVTSQKMLQIRQSSKAKFLISQVVLTFLALVAFSYRAEIEKVEARTLAFLVLAMASALHLLVVGVSLHGPWSAPSIWSVVFNIFHFGALPVLIWPSIAPTWTRDYLSLWLLDSSVKDAMFMSLLFLLLFTQGVLISQFLSDLTRSGAPRRTPLRSESQIGVILTILGSSALVLALLQSGILGGTYRSFLESGIDGTFSATAIFLVGAGVILTTSSRGSRRSVIISVGSFAIFVAIAIPMGLRTAIFLPLASVAMVTGRRRKTRGTFAFVSLLMLMSFAGLLRDVRDGKINNLGEALNPLSSAVEFGFTLRTLDEVILWQANGDDPARGSSYLAFPTRLVEQLHGVPRPERDYRYPDFLMEDRIGPVGFSAASEAFHNFGVLGIVTVGFLTGLLVSTIDRLGERSRLRSLAPLLMLPILYSIRNHSAVIWYQGIYVLLIGLLVWITSSSWHQSRAQFDQNGTRKMYEQVQVQ